MLIITKELLHMYWKKRLASHKFWESDGLTNWVVVSSSPEAVT